MTLGLSLICIFPLQHVPYFHLSLKLPSSGFTVCRQLKFCFRRRRVNIYQTSPSEDRTGSWGTAEIISEKENPFVFPLPWTAMSWQFFRLCWLMGSCGVHVGHRILCCASIVHDFWLVLWWTPYSLTLPYGRASTWDTLGPLHSLTHSSPREGEHIWLVSWGEGIGNSWGVACLPPLLNPLVCRKYLFCLLSDV